VLYHCESKLFHKTNNIISIFQINDQMKRIYIYIYIYYIYIYISTNILKYFFNIFSQKGYFIICLYYKRCMFRVHLFKEPIRKLKREICQIYYITKISTKYYCYNRCRLAEEIFFMYKKSQILIFKTTIVRLVDKKNIENIHVIFSMRIRE